MRIVCTADWHGELPSGLPEGDVLVITGDLLPVWNHSLEYQYEWVDGRLVPYLESLPYEAIIWVAGNHDFLMQEEPEWDLMGLPQKIIYLQDSSYEHEGVKFWGSPWSNKFFDWAFMAEDEELAEKYKQIPADTNVLISHGPPRGACDRNREGKRCGSKSLRAWILEHQPKYCITGHIHEGYGSDLIGDTWVYNVSHMNRDYDPVNSAQVVLL